jgi:hypothetical protein
MRKRLIAAGTALTLAGALGTFGSAGIALAGEDVPAPVTETVTTPAETQTVTTPGPTQTVTSPTKTVTVKTKAPSSSGGGSSNSTSSSSPSRAVSIVPTASTTPSSDTGTVPVGGVQAGAGGTAGQNASPLLMALALGMLMLGLTIGGTALKRRSAER